MRFSNEQIEQAKQAILNLKEQNGFSLLLIELGHMAAVRSCKHVFRELTEEELADEWMSVGAICVECNHRTGWRCKVSPDNICHYFSGSGMVKLSNGINVPTPFNHNADLETDDACIFCGLPEERT